MKQNIDTTLLDEALKGFLNDIMKKYSMEKFSIRPAQAVFLDKYLSLSYNHFGIDYPVIEYKANDYKSSEKSIEDQNILESLVNFCKGNATLNEQTRREFSKLATLIDVVDDMDKIKDYLFKILPAEYNAQLEDMRTNFKDARREVKNCQEYYNQLEQDTTNHTYKIPDNNITRHLPIIHLVVEDQKNFYKLLEDSKNRLDKALNNLKKLEDKESFIHSLLNSNEALKIHINEEISSFKTLGELLKDLNKIKEEYKELASSISQDGKENQK